MDLAPLASALRPVLANLPFAIAEELNASAVDQQVERTVGTAIRDLDGQRLLTTAQGRIIWHGPINRAQPSATCWPPCLRSAARDRKSTRMNSSHQCATRMP